ncbi:SDR family oxidoreductase [Lentimicrobium sp.]
MKNIVISGASNGIGYHTALALAQLPDVRIAIVSRNEFKLQALAGECNLKQGRTIVKPFAYDLSQENLAPLVEKIVSFLGSVDVLINNAGDLVNKAFAETSMDDFNHVMNINLKAPFFLTQHLLPWFKRGSHIVNISSMGGVQGSVKFPGLSLYSASKGSIAILTECLAAELAEAGISVNCLAFGSVQTEMLERAFPGYKASVSPSEMGSYVARFALEGHKFYNGKILPLSLSTP